MNFEKEIEEARLLLAKRVKRYRELRGYTQGELAGIMGCASRVVSEVEGAKRNITIKQLSIFAAALGITPRDLF